jgi:hypothetical protein
LDKNKPDFKAIITLSILFAKEGHQVKILTSCHFKSHDEPIGIPSDQPARWMAVGIAMAIQENGTDSLDYFAMLRGWTLARE